MSVTPQRKMLCAASAVSLSAMAFLIAAAPAGASPMRPLDPPGGCDGYTFPAGFTIKQSDGTVITVNNPAGTADFSGVQATLTGGGKTTTGHAHGGSAGGVNLDFSIDWDGGPTTHFTGVVSSAGNGQGNANSSTGASLVWSSKPQTLNCVMNNPAPVQPAQPQPQVVPAPVAPSIDVSVDQGNPFITFTVHNTSTQDLKCEYNAKKLSGNMGPPTTTKGFTLKAGATTPKNELQFLEIPKGTTYQVDISCTGQNGGTAYSHNFTG
jgi:hypothetical protein